MLEFVVFLCRLALVLSSECLFYLLVSRDRVSLVRRLTSQLASLNMLSVKVFQALALNESFIDQATNNELMQFADNAPWNLNDIDFALLIEVTDKYDIELENGFEAPINAGMISLVFKGLQRSNNGREVIVKIKRREIERRLNSDICNIIHLLNLLSILPIINHFQLADIVHQNIDMLRKQVDFAQEVKNMDIMRENCKHLKYVKIPRVDTEVTTEFADVIVMEYIKGLKVKEVAESDYHGFAKQVVKFGIVTTAMHGIIHGDLHCGNILFIKDSEDAKYPYKVGVIDFGIVYEIGEEFKSMLFDLFTNAFIVSPVESAEKILQSTSVVEPAHILQSIPRDDYENILSLVEEAIKEAMVNANQLQLYKVIEQFYHYVREKPEFKKWGIRPSKDLVKSQLMLAMAHGVTLRLCHGDFLTLMEEVMKELFPFAIRL